MWFDRDGIIDRVARQVIADLEPDFVKRCAPKFVEGNLAEVNLWAPPLFGGWEKLDRERIFTGPTVVRILETPKKPNSSKLHEILTHYWESDDEYDKCGSQHELRAYMRKKMLGYNPQGQPPFYWSYRVEHPVVQYEIAEQFLVLSGTEAAEVIHRRHELEATIAKLSGELRDAEKKAREIGT